MKYPCANNKDWIGRPGVGIDMLLRSMENTVIKVPEAGAENNLLVNNNSGQLRGGGMSWPLALLPINILFCI